MTNKRSNIYIIIQTIRTRDSKDDGPYISRTKSKNCTYFLFET